jgi:hypothetical protein
VLLSVHWRPAGANSEEDPTLAGRPGGGQIDGLQRTVEDHRRTPPVRSR